MMERFDGNVFQLASRALDDMVMGQQRHRADSDCIIPTCVGTEQRYYLARAMSDDPTVTLKLTLAAVHLLGESREEAAKLRYDLRHVPDEQWGIAREAELLTAHATIAGLEERVAELELTLSAYESEGD